VGPVGGLQSPQDNLKHPVHIAHDIMIGNVKNSKPEAV
jgi:hypothetical protein